MQTDVLITIGWIFLLAVLLVLGSVASYLRSADAAVNAGGGAQGLGPSENGRVRPNRERVGVSISALHGACMHLFAVGLTGLLIWRRPEHLWSDLGTALLIVLAAVAIADQLIPFLVVVRHDGRNSFWSTGCRSGASGDPRAAPHLSDPHFHHHPASAGIDRPGARAAIAAENLVELIATGEQEGFIRKRRPGVDGIGGEIRRQGGARSDDAAVEISPINQSPSWRACANYSASRRLTRYPLHRPDGHIEGLVRVRDLMELLQKSRSAPRFAA